MNRRHVFQAALTATVSATLLRTSTLATDAGSDENTIYVHAVNGADDNPGTRDRPLRSLAAAARRVNDGTGTAAATVLLAEGVYAVGETALFKPANHSFTKDHRLTVRAEVRGMRS
jgi:hypothetical protein